MNKAEEKLLKLAHKEMDKEKDKYASGLKHNLFQWEDLVSDLESWFNKKGK